MKLRILFVAALATAFFASPLSASPKPSPTPTPTPAAKKRKLSGGSFGVPPAPTPAGGANTESLATAARKAQEEPATSGSGSTRKIVITNETLGKSEPTPGGTSITISGGAGSKPVVKVPPTPVPAAPDASPAPTVYRDASGRTEAEWRERASAVREKVESTQAALDAANAEARRLENDFYAWSDGNYRERVIRPAWDQAKEQVKGLEEELDKAKAAVADLEEEARKSGTPPGWLR